VVQQDKPLEALIKAKADELGFAACGIARADAAPRAGERLREWLATGAHGSMIWMEERAHHRASPAGLWPEVRSVIALGMSYAPAVDPLALAGAGEIGRISVYAQGSDYHDTIKRNLKALGRWLVAQAPADIKVFVDTAPVMEKPLAEAAGLGWQGKHTNLVSRSHGSWLFLGAIYTTLDLAPDMAGEETCGSCVACQDACPTNAFPAPFRLDARRCISYLTIEHAGPIAPELRPLIGNRIYGCDDCQLVCPWNKFATKSTLPDFDARAPLNDTTLLALWLWDEAEFLRRTEGSAIRRIGFERWQRNLAVALGNALAEAATEADDAAVRAALADRRAGASPMVREHIDWALAQRAGTLAR
jgi:epoxyqueuosine reductase